MNLLVAGSRDFQPVWENGTLKSGWTQAQMSNTLSAALEALRESVSVVVHGAARGVDQMAGEWAIELGLAVDAHPADWNNLGKRAGYVRNAEMVKIADCAIFVWDGKSKGTRHSIRLVHDKGIPYVVVIKNPLESSLF